MRLLLLLLMALGMPVFTAYAQDDMSEESDGEEMDDGETMTQPRNEDPGPPPAYDGESEAARQGKKGGVELGSGLIVGAVPGAQFHPYYNINPNFSVGLLYNSGSLDFGSEISSTPGAKIKSAEINATVIMAHARYFVGNSFYVNGGIGQRKIGANFNVQSTIADYGIKSEIEATSTALMVAIGNQWQWDGGFSLGVEWLGYIVPLSASSSDSLSETGADASTVSAAAKDSVADLKEDGKELAETIGELSTPRLLMLSLGWSF